MFMAHAAKKKPASIILEAMSGPIKPKEEQDQSMLPPTPSMPEAPAEDNVGQEAAAEEVISAMKADDPKALLVALKALLEMCRED